MAGGAGGRNAATATLPRIQKVSARSGTMRQSRLLPRLAHGDSRLAAPEPVVHAESICDYSSRSAMRCADLDDQGESNLIRFVRQTGAIDWSTATGNHRGNGLCQRRRQ